MTRLGFGWPTCSRALALTAFVTENFSNFRFFLVTARVQSRVCPPSHEYGILLKDRKQFFRRQEVGLLFMDEREFFDEKSEMRKHTLTCPHCGKSEEYEIAWMVRRKKARLPQHADERDRARFAKAQSYMVRKDDVAGCKNIRCRKRFEVSSLQSVAFL